VRMRTFCSRRPDEYSTYVANGNANGLSVEKRIIRGVRSQDDESDRNKIDSKSI
jgi:hypothetical protein